MGICGSSLIPIIAVIIVYTVSIGCLSFYIKNVIIEFPTFSTADFYTAFFIVDCIIVKQIICSAPCGMAEFSGSIILADIITENYLAALRGFIGIAEHIYSIRIFMGIVILINMGSPISPIHIPCHSII